MAIVRDVPGFVAKLAAPACTPAMLALFAGMRLGEVLALRDRQSISTARGDQVREALEETKARRSCQGAEVRGRPPRHHPAGHRGRGAAGAPQGSCSKCG